MIPRMRKQHPRFQPPARSAGFTLLEAMIALVVLSVGLLGLAGLQAQGLRFNHDAYVRSQGTILAYDMIERMRTNAANAASYIGGAPATLCGAGGSLAENDRACWHQIVAQTLPGGSATITAGGGGLYDITLTWLDRSSGNNITQSWAVIIN